MNVSMLAQAEAELEEAFDYYQLQRPGLGLELLDEFRRGVDRIVEFPNAWQALDDLYRRYRLRRFPYGIVYRIGSTDSDLMVVAFAHLRRRPGSWRGR